MAPEEIDLTAARGGQAPGTGEPILAGIGSFGPWLPHRSSYAPLPDDDMLRIGLNRAVAPIADKEVPDSRSRGPKRVLRELGPHPEDGAPVWLKAGHYDPFVAHRRRYASLPPDVEPEALTLEQALARIEKEAGPAGGKPRGR